MLAMADYNRIADGIDEATDYHVVFVAQADPEITDNYFASLIYIYDQLNKPNWENREVLSGKLGLVGVHTVIERSKLFREGVIPGTSDLYNNMCSRNHGKYSDLLQKLGLDPIPEFWLVFPDFKVYRGQAALLWDYKAFPTSKEADDFLDSLAAAGVPREIMRVRIVSIGKTTHLSSSEVLADVFGFREHLIHSKTSRRLAGGLRFDRAAIGEARYNAAMASTSKAMEGLQRRNLAAHMMYAEDRSFIYAQAGIRLTQEGIEEAGRIKAKDPDILRDLSLYAGDPVAPTADRPASPQAKSMKIWDKAAP
jgi:hypothetical protein